jgi:small subunit ribosomal protein S18
LRKRQNKNRRKKTFQRHKICRFCADSSLIIDYKDCSTLRHFVTERGKMIPRRISGNCARHQRKITSAVKRARNIALLPFASVQ